MGGAATLPALILAHQGGWDEALFVLGPLVIIGLLLVMANKRAERVAAAKRADEVGDEVAEEVGDEAGEDATAPGSADER